MKFNSVSYSTLEHETADGREIALKLYHQPEDHEDALIYESGGKLIVGYLVHDSDCANPLEDCDGMGHIYSAHRNSSTQQEMREALGLNRDWEPNLDIVADEDELVQRCLKKIQEEEDLFAQALAMAEEECERHEGESDLDFIKNRFGCRLELEDLMEDAVWSIAQDLWKEGRMNGTIGNRYAVSLDVYEHGLVSYNVSGNGMQCQFDTARGGAVWVPDQCCEEEIVTRGKAYRKGDVLKHTLKSKTLFCVRTLKKDTLSYDDAVHPNFSSWSEAYDYLKKLELTEEQGARSEYQAEMVAAHEIAQQACEVYTDWCNGNCFGYAVERFNLEGVADGAEVSSEDEDSCWGFVGDNFAYESLQEAFDSKKKRL